MFIKTSNRKKLQPGFNTYYYNWSIHICGLYKTVEKRGDIVLEFNHARLVAGSIQRYCPTERSKEISSELYDKKHPAQCYYLYDEYKFCIASVKDLYCPNGKF